MDGTLELNGVEVPGEPMNEVEEAGGLVRLMNDGDEDRVGMLQVGV